MNFVIKPHVEMFPEIDSITNVYVDHTAGKLVVEHFGIPKYHEIVSLNPYLEFSRRDTWAVSAGLAKLVKRDVQPGDKFEFLMRQDYDMGDELFQARVTYRHTDCKMSYEDIGRFTSVFWLDADMSITTSVNY